MTDTIDKDNPTPEVEELETTTRKNIPVRMPEPLGPDDDPSEINGTAGEPAGMAIFKQKEI